MMMVMVAAIYLGLVEVVAQHGQFLDGLDERVEHLLVLVEQRLQLLRTSHRPWPHTTHTASLRTIVDRVCCIMGPFTP